MKPAGKPTTIDAATWSQYESKHAVDRDGAANFQATDDFQVRPLINWLLNWKVIPVLLKLRKAVLNWNIDHCSGWTARKLPATRTQADTTTVGAIFTALRAI